MKTATITLYSFSELSPKAKARAKYDHAEAFGFSLADDYLESLKVLAGHFNGKLADYSVSPSYSFATFDMPEDMSEDGIAAKMAELGTFNAETFKGNGDCVLTGFCADESAIDGFRAAWSKGERDLSRLMGAAFRSWLKDALADYAGQMEDDAFAETCEANGWLFLESGATPPKHIP